ncbi:inorganic phosphate transporter [bacterium]|nr:inorganic phosphate transporter [bacterium]
MSTTQVVTSTIRGASSAERPKGVRWEVIREILITWLVTIPVVAMLSMLIYLVINKFL